MNKTENLRLHPDPRCNRFSPDALPTHRQCPDCPPGANVHPLDAQHFYERRTRFPWNLSRFTSRCREHHRQMTSAVYAANADARNAQRSERRRVVRANKKQAAIFYTPEQVAIRQRREAEQRERKERLALYKRRSVRARGGYDPSRDGIKLLIKSRMQDAMKRRLQTKSQRATCVTRDHALGDEPSLSKVDAIKNLERLRELHRSQGKAQEEKG